jgi:hypothetical protein
MPETRTGLVCQVWALAYAHALAEANDMTNPKGTKAETKVVNWLKSQEFWAATRVVKKGARDQGDVQICNGVMVQVKDGYTEGREPTDFLIGKWLAAVDEQIKNGGWEIGMLCHKKAGKGDPSDWRWYVAGDMFRKLILPPEVWEERIQHGWVIRFPPYVQLQGYMVPQLLRNAGYSA